MPVLDRRKARSANSIRFSFDRMEMLSIQGAEIIEATIEREGERILTVEGLGEKGEGWCTMVGRGE